VVIAIVGAAVLGLAVSGLSMTRGIANEAALAALKDQGGSMPTANMESYRQIAAYTHMEECALAGLTGIVLLGVGILNATTPARESATRG
jgi:hypothetical protein